MTTTQPKPLSESDLQNFFAKFNFNFVLSDVRSPDAPIIFASEGFYSMTGYS